MARLGEALAGPEQMVHGLLEWAVVHGQVDRVRLLAEHGVNLRRYFADGHPDVAAVLRERGADALAPDGAHAALTAVMSGDRETVSRHELAEPLQHLRFRRPGLVVWVAASGRPDAVRLLVELGWDVSALGRSDAPVEQRWHTALHAAAFEDDIEMARLLVSLGADPNARDVHHDSTPLGWAQHAGAERVVPFLEPLTD